MEPGFDGTGVVAAKVSLDDARYESAADVNRLFREALQNLSGATSKVIFDLAKPQGETNAAAVAAALGANVRVADEQSISDQPESARPALRAGKRT